MNEKEVIEKILSVKVQVQTNFGKKELEFIEYSSPIISHVSEIKDVVRHGLTVGKELIENYTAIILGKSTIAISDMK